MKAERYLIAADTREFPGKVKLTFVRFETEIVPAGPEFDGREFTFLDSRLPEATVLTQILHPQKGGK